MIPSHHTSTIGRKNVHKVEPRIPSRVTFQQVVMDSHVEPDRKKRKSSKKKEARKKLKLVLPKRVEGGGKLQSTLDRWLFKKPRTRLRFNRTRPLQRDHTGLCQLDHRPSQRLLAAVERLFDQTPRSQKPNEK